MNLVFLLYDYAEHGPENLVATLDRQKLMGLVDNNWADAPADWLAQGKAGLARLLELSDQQLFERRGGCCHDGWGGMALDVVKLA